MSPQLLLFVPLLLLLLLQKCGVGLMACTHHGSWQALERWAEKQGLTVPTALKRYQQLMYA